MTHKKLKRITNKKEDKSLWIKHIAFRKRNKLFIPESFNINISHQLFDYITTFVNSQQ